MQATPKHLKRLVREWAAVAHERDLREALGKLRVEFARWERGEIDSFELNDRVHRYHRDDRAARAGAALYLTVGEHENDRLRGGVANLAKAFESRDAGAAPAWSFLDMKDEDHSSTPQRSLYHVLETRYAGWRFPFFEDGAELERAGGLTGLEAHYARASTRFGFTSPPPDVRLRQVARIYIEAGRHEDAILLSEAYVAEYPVFAEAVVNLVGYDQLRRGQVEQGVRTFTRNVKAFPDSPNVYDSLGDAYCKAGDAAAGRRSYEDAARVAAKRSPPHPRLAWYQDKAKKGCG